MNFLVLVAALIVGLPALIMAYNVLEVRRWHRASGVVTSTGLKLMRYPGSSARSYQPVIRYTYMVNGVEYRGNVFTHGMESGSHKPSAQKILDRYPPGSSVTVLHHPTQPNRACLCATFGFFGWVFTVLSLLLLLLAINV